MRELKLLTHTFSTPKKPAAGSFTLKTKQVEQTGSIQYHNTFCSGLCTEATCFEQLCGACVSEYFEYKESRNEM
jgi:hypothetical protein